MGYNEDQQLFQKQQHQQLGNENNDISPKVGDKYYYQSQLELIEITQGAHKARALNLVTKLKVASLLADEKPHTVDELAEKLGVDPTTLFKIMRALSTIGVFKHHDEQGVTSRLFSQSRLSRLLNDSCTRDAILFKGGDGQYTGWQHIEDTLKTGRASISTNVGKGYPTYWSYLWDTPSELHLFEKGMSGLTTPLLPHLLGMSDFSKFEVVADLGGSQGVLIQEILKLNPNLKKGINFDVLETIENNKKLDRSKVDPRFCEMSGSFFESVPEADCYTMSKIIHDWDLPQCKKILETIGKSIKPNGKVYIYDLILEKDRVGYSYRTWKDLDLWHNCNGQERSEQEFRDIAEAAGFKVDQFVEDYLTIMSKK